MAYICQKCGVMNENPNKVCKPIDEQYKKKSCALGTPEVCENRADEMTYSCDCGNVSANPQHLCKPSKI